MSYFVNNRWYMYTARQTVDHALFIDAQHLRGYYQTNEDFDNQVSSGRAIGWQVNGRSTGSAMVFVNWIDGHPRLELRYTVSGKHDIKQVIQTETTQPYYGGVRYWFTCPQCKRRCRKLHLPGGALRFYCRQCHDLTYESCQSQRKHGGKLGALFSSFEDYRRVERIYEKLHRARVGSKRWHYWNRLANKYRIRAMAASAAFDGMSVYD